jgi:hypothetical protein
MTLRQKEATVMLTVGHATEDYERWGAGCGMKETCLLFEGDPGGRKL